MSSTPDAALGEQQTEQEAAEVEQQTAEKPDEESGDKESGESGESGDEESETPWSKAGSGAGDKAAEQVPEAPGSKAGSESGRPADPEAPGSKAASRASEEVDKLEQGAKQGADKPVEAVWASPSSTPATPRQRVPRFHSPDPTPPGPRDSVPPSSPRSCASPSSTRAPPPTELFRVCLNPAGVERYANREEHTSGHLRPGEEGIVERQGRQRASGRAWCAVRSPRGDVQLYWAEFLECRKKRSGWWRPVFASCAVRRLKSAGDPTPRDETVTTLLVTRQGLLWTGLDGQLFRIFRYPEIRELGIYFPTSPKVSSPKKKNASRLLIAMQHDSDALFESEPDFESASDRTYDTHGDINMLVNAINDVYDETDGKIVQTGGFTDWDLERFQSIEESAKPSPQQETLPYRTFQEFSLAELSRTTGEQVDTLQRLCEDADMKADELLGQLEDGENSYRVYRDSDIGGYSEADTLQAKAAGLRCLVEEAVAELAALAREEERLERRREAATKQSKVSRADLMGAIFDTDIEEPEEGTLANAIERREQHLRKIEDHRLKAEERINIQFAELDRLHLQQEESGAVERGSVPASGSDDVTAAQLHRFRMLRSALGDSYKERQRQLHAAVIKRDVLLERVTEGRNQVAELEDHLRMQEETRLFVERQRDEAVAGHPAHQVDIAERVVETSIQLKGAVINLGSDTGFIEAVRDHCHDAGSSVAAFGAAFDLIRAAVEREHGLQRPGERWLLRKSGPEPGEEEVEGLLSAMKQLVICFDMMSASQQCATQHIPEFARNGGTLTAMAVQFARRWEDIQLQQTQAPPPPSAPPATARARRASTSRTKSGTLKSSK
eukprot:Hpha_TRINITY_DN15702_c2_g2::TRINITY_DN15702_c2_g2_i1::g.37889::m.37889